MSIGTPLFPSASHFSAGLPKSGKSVQIKNNAIRYLRCPKANYEIPTHSKPLSQILNELYMCGVQNMFFLVPILQTIFSQKGY